MQILYYLTEFGDAVVETWLKSAVWADSQQTIFLSDQKTYVLHEMSVQWSYRGILDS